MGNLSFVFQLPYYIDGDVKLTQTLAVCILTEFWWFAPVIFRRFRNWTNKSEMRNSWEDWGAGIRVKKGRKV